MSVTLLVVADGCSLTELRRGEDAGRGGARVQMELGIRKELDGFLTVSHLSPIHPQPEITCLSPDA